MRRVMQEAMFGGRPCAPVMRTANRKPSVPEFCPPAAPLRGVPRLRSMTRAWWSDKRQEFPGLYSKLFGNVTSQCLIHGRKMKKAFCFDIIAISSLNEFTVKKVDRSVVSDVSGFLCSRQPCNQQSCDDPVPCVLSEWSAWEGLEVSAGAKRRSGEATD